MIVAMGERLHKNSSGFPIIEVVLVLAVGGLVFLAVFLALPGMQLAQRDNQRKSDVGVVVAAVRTYIVDHDNQLPPDSGVTEVGNLDVNGDGVIDDDERQQIWQDGNPSNDLAPYIREVIGNGVTTHVSVYDTTRVSGLNVMVGSTDRDGLITVFLGAKCPTQFPRPNVMAMILTQNKQNVAVFRYLEAGNNFCRDF